VPFDARAAFALALALALAIGACARRSSESEAAPSASALAFHLPEQQLDKIRVTTVGPGTIRRGVEATGIVDFDQNASTHVVSSVSGRVVEVLVSLGAHVPAGAPLARIASPDFASEVSAYRKSAVLAAHLRGLADVDKQLLAAGNIGKRELEQADADAVSAEADREASAALLKTLGLPPPELAAILDGRAPVDTLAVLHAPMDGVVVEQLLSPGELLEPGATPCFTIARLDEMWIQASVFEADLRRVSVGSTAEIRAATSADPFMGRVDVVGDLVDPETRAVAVRVVAKNRDRLLKKGAYVSVSIRSSEDSPALLVPSSAVLLDSESLPFVFLQNADHDFLRRRVTTGARSGGSLEVTAGLAPGDVVVAEGGLFVQFAQDQ
jgi:cobalt-zinc-cadmium efflux system membrane fusion protein